LNANLQILASLLMAAASDYASFEAGTAVTAPAWDIDLTALGIGKVSLVITAKKVV
jgi:hypothetical protein